MFLDSLGWKAGAIGAFVLNAVTAGALAYVHIQNVEIQHQRDHLQSAITDPQTGYVARLTQAQNNVTVLKTTLEDQNRQFQAKSAESAAQLAETKRQLEAAQKESRAAKAQVKAFLDKPIKGDTLEKRILDVDNRAMKEFLK